MRRGLQLDALKEFILSQGASRNVTLQEWDKIWTINKRIIDPVCPRHTAVKQAARVKLHLSNGPATPEVVAVPKHKKYAPAGVKATTHTQVQGQSACMASTDPSCALMLTSLASYPIMRTSAGRHGEVCLAVPVSAVRR